MDDPDKTRLLSALTTEHFVLQSAASSTISESAARSSLYVFALSSALVAMGFTARSDAFVPFVAAVLPALFLLGLFTVVRLVDTVLENMQYLAGIARIRAHYRTISPEAAELFAARDGRWPESFDEPSLRFGNLLAFFGTTASMVAIINSVVAGAGVALAVNHGLGGDRTGIALAAGAAVTVLLTVLFVLYQRWRFATLRLAVRPGRGPGPRK
jgi:hypothetical protein